MTPFASQAPQRRLPGSRGRLASQKAVLVLFGCLLFGLAASLAAEPKTLAQQLAADNLRMISFLQSLVPKQQNTVLRGIKLSDGTSELQGATFIVARYLAAKKQYIYLSKSEGSYRAYAWVERGGQPLQIPEDKDGSPGENAGLLSGDIFNFTKVDARDGLVILFGATPAWLEKL